MRHFSGPGRAGPGASRAAQLLPVLQAELADTSAYVG
jgi:hypothetical protein